MPNLKAQKLPTNVLKLIFCSVFQKEESKWQKCICQMKRRKTETLAISRLAVRLTLASINLI